MERFRRTWMQTALAGIALLGTPFLARADLIVSISLGNGPAFQVVDNGPYDTNPAVGQITTGSSVFGPSGVFTGFTGSVSASVTETSLLATLSTTTNLQRADSVGSGQLVIETTREGYNLPVGPNLFLGGSTTGTFTNVPPGGGNYTFQGWADPNNAHFGMGPITTGLEGPFNSTALSPNSFSNDTPGVPFTRLATPYSLTGRTSFDLDGAVGGNLVATSSATVLLPSAVPEPASVLMLATGGMAGLLWYARRRWRVA